MKNYVAAVDACFKEMAADYAAKKVGSWADRSSVAGKPAPTWEDAIRATNAARMTPHPHEPWGFVCHEGTFTCEEVDANMNEEGERYRVEEAWKRADAAASAFVKECRRERLRRGWKDADDYRYGRDQHKSHENRGTAQDTQFEDIVPKCPKCVEQVSSYQNDRTCWKCNWVDEHETIPKRHRRSCRCAECR